jgi:ribonuclease HI
VEDRSRSRRRPRRKGGTLRDGERRQLALASRQRDAETTPAQRSSRARVLCDGGSRGNPGPAAVAAVLLASSGEVRDQHAVAIGRASAAAAEYRALLLGLELAAGNGIETLDVCSDSRLAIAGVQGSGPAQPDLAALATLVRTAADQFAEVGWRWHPRSENRAADALVRALLWP